jgi:hypothetical protein
MNNNTQLIYYEHIHAKIHWKYTSSIFTNDDIGDIKIDNLKREIAYCYGSTRYIMGFIEMLKHKVIRLLPNLSDVKIMLGIYDKNNILHNLMVGAYYIVCKMLKKEVNKNHIYKTVITVIQYKGETVFMGGLCFDGIE